jgi:hypothetical protein
VVGLPLARLHALMRELGWTDVGRPARKGRPHRPPS